MIPRLDISFSFKRQKTFWVGQKYLAADNEFLLNHARSGIVLALQVVFPNGGSRVGVVAYNCDTVMNAVVQSGCTPVFLDITDELTIDVKQENIKHCDAIIVTNLFGIQNDIDSIKQRCKNCVIIVDNAHGYNLKREGDFTVYSIDQGKSPSLGEGGILVVNNNHFINDIKYKYSKLKSYSAIAQIKLFFRMLVKAILYNEWIYTFFTVRLKKSMKKNGMPEKICLSKMCGGVRRLYQLWINTNDNHSNRRTFMDIVRTDNKSLTIMYYTKLGIEVDTHFKYWRYWAYNYGYTDGLCPQSESLVDKLVMIPNYYR